MQRMVSKTRRLHYAALLVMLAATAWLARPQGDPPPPAPPAACTWYYPLKETLLRLVLPSPSKVFAPAPEEEQPVVEEQKPFETPEVEAPHPDEIWPSSVRKDLVRLDEAWSVDDVPLQLSVAEFQQWYPYSEESPYGSGLEKTPDFKIGTVTASGTACLFDVKRNVRAVRGETLQVNGTPLLRIGGSGPEVEDCLGAPQAVSAHSFRGRTGATTWTYQYDHSVLEIHFKARVIKSIYLRDRSFRDSGC